MIVSSLKKMIVESLSDGLSLRVTPDGFTATLIGAPEKEVIIKDVGGGLFVVTSDGWSVEGVKKEDLGYAVAFFMTQP